MSSISPTQQYLLSLDNRLDPSSLAYLDFCFLFHYLLLADEEFSRSHPATKSLPCLSDSTAAVAEITTTAAVTPIREKVLSSSVFQAIIAFASSHKRRDWKLKQPHCIQSVSHPSSILFEQEIAPADWRDRGSSSQEATRHPEEKLEGRRISTWSIIPQASKWRREQSVSEWCL